MWTALGTWLTWETVIEQEIRDILGLQVYVPRYVVEFFHRRRRTRISRTELLMPGYMMVHGIPNLHKLPHFRQTWSIADKRGNPVPIPEIQIAEFMLRQISGQFDVKIGSGMARPTLPRKGTRVRVVFFNWLGTVVKVTNSRYCEVRMDGSPSWARPVLVTAAGLDPV